MRARDHYDTLEVSPKASPKEIEAAFRRLTHFYHPDDYSSHPGKYTYAHEKQRELNIAYDVLKDPAKRAAYNAERGHDRWEEPSEQQAAERQREGEAEEARRQEAEQRAAEERHRREENARGRAEEEARRRREGRESQTRPDVVSEDPWDLWIHPVPAWMFSVGACVFALFALTVQPVWLLFGVIAVAFGTVGWWAARAAPAARWLAGAAIGLVAVLAALFAVRDSGIGNPPYPSEKPPRTNPKDGATMLYIPAGEFLMGSKDRDDTVKPYLLHENEMPQREVYLDEYWIYEFEVTVAQYRKFCQETNRKMPVEPAWGWHDDHPICNVTWNAAAAYAQWAGISLPTEAQWEKAARGTDGRKFPWGNAWSRRKCANSVRPSHLTSTRPVGSYPKGMSPYRVHDMAGNVWEWCADWYNADYYKNAPNRNPTGPSAGTERVFRGGSWKHFIPNYFRCADRVWSTPGGLSHGGGFRCVVSRPVS